MVSAASSSFTSKFSPWVLSWQCKDNVASFKVGSADATDRPIRRAPCSAASFSLVSLQVNNRWRRRNSVRAQKLVRLLPGYRDILPCPGTEGQGRYPQGRLPVCLGDKDGGSVKYHGPFPPFLSDGCLGIDFRTQFLQGNGRGRFLRLGFPVSVRRPVGVDGTEVLDVFFV